MTAIIILSVLLAAATAAIIWTYIKSRRRGEYYEQMLTRHSETVNEAYAAMREWRHDYKNQLQTMSAYLAEGRYERLGQYLMELNADLVEADTVVKTGNAALDAVVNTKLAPAVIQGIRLTIDAHTPEGMCILDVDICKIAANLLENAVEAARECADGFIRVYIGTLKGQLYISVLNSTAAEPVINNGKYVTTKHTSEHGMGIKSVERTVQKYGGWIEQKHDEDLFSTEILIPLSAE